MRYYLDTNVLVYLLSQSKDDLHFTVKNILYDFSNILYVSSIAIKDMNDHAIIVQAISDKIPLISSDTRFHDYVAQGLDFVFNKR
jgi:PIN domain nuclease of toxin-antitoxin system